MFDDSIIKRTNQLWKFLVGFVILLASFGLMLHGFLSIESMEAGTFAVLFLTAIFFAFTSFVWQVLAIRCPSCGAHWFWISVKSQNQANWLIWLLKQRECPKCQYVSQDELGS